MSELPPPHPTLDQIEASLSADQRVAVERMKEQLMNGKEDFAAQVRDRALLPATLMEREDIRQLVEERMAYLLTNGYLDHYDDFRQLFDRPAMDRERIVQASILKALEFNGLIETSGELILRYSPAPAFLQSPALRSAVQRAADKQPYIRNREPWKSILNPRQSE